MQQALSASLSGMAARIVRWQSRHGRHQLPWQTLDPYRVWLSEIMLQQTQVSTVIGYYQRFIERFPDVFALAAASLDEVMPYWAGLGYYARARNLHRCAWVVVNEYQGRFPSTAAQLATLPGIGPSTAAAIAAFSFGERRTILDGNVKRVFTRFFGIYGVPTLRATERQLWDVAQAIVDAAEPDLDMARYTQGLMDLGATVCTRTKPACSDCPLQQDCHARKHAVQHILPQARARKAVPQRQCAMLILQCDDRVLLQQQPSPGLWEGLWSLPRFDDDDALRAALINHNVTAVQHNILPSFQHVFSHFRLQIQPHHVVAERRTPHLSEPGVAHAWEPLDAVSGLALPAPVKTLLIGLSPHAIQALDGR